MLRLLPLSVLCSIAVASLDVYNGCGVTKGCFGTPKNCESASSCLALVTYRPVGEDYEFELVGRHYSENYGNVAVGFSSSKEMDFETATECVLSGSQFKLFNLHSRLSNSFRSNRRLPEMEQTGLNLTKAVASNGFMYCRFTQPKVATEKAFDLSKPWYILISAGGITEGNSDSHDGIVGRSSYPVNLDEATIVSPPAPLSIGVHLIYTGCGKTKGCFGHPNNCVDTQSCNILVTYRNYSATQFELELYGVSYSSKKHKSAGSYVAVGFSEDRRMGDDMVVDCSMIGGKPAVAMSYNMGHHNERLQNPLLGVELLEGREENGYIYCKLLREGIIEDRSRVMDITNNDYYLLLAAGPADADRIHEHKSETASQNKVHLNDFGGVNASDFSFLVTWHGILMTVAWMFLISSASFLPRHHKQSWSEKQLFQNPVWFSLHRLFNGLALFVTLYGVVIIFVAVAGWVDTEDPVASAHAILGLIVTGFAILQPIAAFVRPAPEHPKRWIFNLCHAVTGYCMYILAVVNMFLGAILRDGIKPWAKWIIIAFAIVYVVMQIAHTLFRRAPMKRSSSIENILGKPKNEVTAIEVVWYCYVVIAVGLTVGVIVALV